MKSVASLVCLLVGVSLTTLIGCDDPEGPAYVYGTAFMDPGTTADFDGKLSKSGGDYYGFCQYTDGKFNFTVGFAKPNDLSSSKPLYMNFVGIVGPGDNGDPEVGVYEAPDANGVYPIKTGADYWSRFQRGQVASYRGGTFNVDGNDPNCKVRLFAVSDKENGELLQGDDPENPLNKHFEYYVDVDCVNVAGTSGATLRSVTARFFFDNC